MLEQLFTETDTQPIDWEKTAIEATESLFTSAGDSSQGFWVDCDQCVRPGKLSSSIENRSKMSPRRSGPD